MEPLNAKPAASTTTKTMPDLNTSAQPEKGPEPGSVASWQEAAAFDAMMGRHSRSMDEYYENEARAAARDEQRPPEK